MFVPERPPSEWFEKLGPSLCEQYSKYSPERTARVAAGRCMELMVILCCLVFLLIYSNQLQGYLLIEPCSLPLSFPRREVWNGEPPDFLLHRSTIFKSKEGFQPISWFAKGIWRRFRSFAVSRYASSGNDFPDDKVVPPLASGEEPFVSHCLGPLPCWSAEVGSKWMIQGNVSLIIRCLRHQFELSEDDRDTSGAVFVRNVAVCSVGPLLDGASDGGE